NPIVHLRSFSNYMTPKLGLLSADTWTLVAIFIRNLILNWFVLLPPIILVLLIPRFCLAAINFDLTTTALPHAALAVAVFSGIIPIAYVYANRPSLADAKLRDAAAGSIFPNEHKTQSAFLRWCLFPLSLLAVLSTTSYAWWRINPAGLWMWFIG